MSHLLQKCLDIFHHTESDNGFNLFLVLTGARPGMRAECYETLLMLDSEHGPSVTYAVATRYLESHVPKDETKPWPKHLARINDVAFKTLIAEYMHVILSRIRDLVDTQRYIVEPSGAEVYVVKKSFEKDFAIAALSPSDESTIQAYRALAKLFGYPVLKRPPHRHAARTKSIVMHVANDAGAPRNARADHIISLYWFVWDTEPHLRQQERRVADIRKAMSGLSYDWRGQRFTITDVTMEDDGLRVP